jgi:hypothetical protein
MYPVLSTRELRGQITDFLPIETVNPTKTVKKVIVFTTMSPGIVGAHPDSGSFNSIADGFRYHLGRHLGHPVSAEVFRLAMPSVYPRDVMWTMFPIVSDPWWTTENRASEIAQADHIVFLENPNSSRHANEMAAYRFAWGVRQLGFGDRVFLVLSSDQKTFESRSIESLMAPAAGTMRMDYSYLVNFSAIAGKALRHVLDGGELLSGADLERLGKITFCEGTFANNHIYGLDTKLATNGMISSLGKPFVLQWLYALRKKGCLDLAGRITEGDGRFRLRGPLLEGLLKQGDASSWLWEGTGKYAPQPVGDRNESGHSPNLVEYGLVDVDIGKAVARLTDRGHRFLDLMHPDCEDPDVVLRWADPATGLVDARHLQAVHDWNMRFFSKMKTRVNKIA